MKAITTQVPFTVEGSESEVYEGTARCRVTAATRPTWSDPGEPPEVEILDIVIYTVTPIVQGVPLECKYIPDDGIGKLTQEVRERLEGNETFEEDAFEAARDEYVSFMCRGE